MWKSNWLWYLCGYTLYIIGDLECHMSWFYGSFVHYVRKFPIFCEASNDFKVYKILKSSIEFCNRNARYDGISPIAILN